MNRFLRLYILLAISFCCKSTGLCNYSTHKSRQNTLTEEKKYILPDSFFAKVAVANIGTIDTTNVKYRKRDMELSGYAYSPVIGYENIADKKPKYAVFIQDNFTIKKNYSKNDKKYLTNTVKAYILIIVKQTKKEG